ncbi:MAG: methyltransferase [Deltaproteobacteria bacterium]|nr:methyltransferase [Deltaproteobacteria bacterium]
MPRKNVPPEIKSGKIGPYRFLQGGAGQKLTADSVLLADFIPPLKETDSIIELGCGAGALLLLLAWKSRASKITGIEIEGKAASIAADNIALNGLDDRVGVLKSDYREIEGVFPKGSFNAVVSNPPYMKKGACRISPTKERALARSEVEGEISDLIAVSKYLVADGGKVYFVFPVARLFEMLGCLRAAGLRPLRLRFARVSKAKPAKIFLLEAGMQGELTIEEEV